MPAQPKVKSTLSRPMPKASKAEKQAPAAGVRTIKKYPNRRLYDTQTSSYVTLAEIKKMVMSALPVQVLDAKTGEDLTRSIFLQIILEEESAGLPMFLSLIHISEPTRPY